MGVRRDETDPPPAKVPKTDAKAPTGTPTSGTSNAEMSSGTKGTKTLPGTAAGQASGGASSEGQTFHAVERPLSTYGKSISTYRKVHKFMTFGLAPKVIAGKYSQDRWMTTYLAEVPWHLPVFYLTPSEYNLLRPGAVCVGLELEVIYRGSTIQFETAASASSLATLNQINDIAHAVGLNKTGIGSNVSFTSFDDKQPMLPTGVARPRYQPIAQKYRGLIADYYGDDNDSADFGGNIPHHQVGRQTFLYNYFALSTRKAGASNADTDQYGGWPMLTENIHQMDGKTVVNRTVCSIKYKPRMGQLNQTFKSFKHGLPVPNAGKNMYAPVCGSLAAGRTAILLKDNFDAATTKDAATGDRWTVSEANVLFSNDDAVTASIPKWDIYSPIEKDQISRYGMWGDTPIPQIQPSVHIGVQPVPSLSTAALLAGSDSVFNNWTDTRAYWEVVATMHIAEHTPTHLPHAKVPNVKDNMIQTLQKAYIPPYYMDPSREGATFDGLYVSGTDPILDAAT